MIYSKIPQLVLNNVGNISIGGDSNSPMEWHNGKLQQYSSTYPQGGQLGGVTGFTARQPNIEGSVVAGGSAVSGDRSFLDTFSPPAYGPWFEAVIADASGNLFAYYHTETIIYGGTKIHPAIGCQISTNGGLTWADAGGLIINTPNGTDVPQGGNTQLGYGFMGGNGDCSAILDKNSEYVYFFFSQYGATAAVQGICMARMLWSERFSPVGKVYKYHNGAFTEPGVGGQTTQLVSNVGDIHGQFAAQDYWWGPSISYNTYLDRYVICLNRSNNGGFTYTGDNTNWFTTCPSLTNPNWHFPERIPFTGGYLGNWYPMSVGLDSGLGTDKHCGRVARIFSEGNSNWRGTYYRPLQNPEPKVITSKSRRGSR